jgi:hypothetical protein
MWKNAVEQAGRATVDNTAHAFYMLDNKATDTPNM